LTSVVAVGGGVAVAGYANTATDFVAVETYAGRRVVDDDVVAAGIRIESAAVPPVAVAFGPALFGGVTVPDEPPPSEMPPPPPPHAITATEKNSAVAASPSARFITASTA
jgi:hypothetical protein